MTAILLVLWVLGALWTLSLFAINRDCPYRDAP